MAIPPLAISGAHMEDLGIDLQTTAGKIQRKAFDVKKFLTSSRRIEGRE
jgi:hypothetical protein